VNKNNIYKVRTYIYMDVEAITEMDTKHVH